MLRQPFTFTALLSAAALTLLPAAASAAPPKGKVECDHPRRYGRYSRSGADQNMEITEYRLLRVDTHV